MNVPKLRFKDENKADYPDWQFANFGDVFTFKSTNSYSRECLNYEIGTTKNIHYGDIHTKFKTLFDINNEKVPFVNSDISLDKVNTEAFCRVGDLVIADASEDYKDIGKSIEIINLNNQAVIAGLHTFLARPAIGLLSTGFMGYAMQSTAVRLQVMTIAQGTKILSISTGRLAKVQIPLPKVEEQQKIADFLSAVDEKITALTAQKTALTQYKQGMMQRIFAQTLRFKDDNGVEYPEWDIKTLGELAKKSTSKNKDESVKTVFTNSAVQGIVNQLDFFDKDIANQNNLANYYIVEKNDFVYNPRISKFAPVGPIKRNHLGTGVMSPLYTVFRFNEGNLGFMSYLFDTAIWHDYMFSIANFGVRFDRMNISQADFFEMPIAYPCIEEQTKIAQFLTELDDKINAVDAQIQSAQQWKQGLLQQMFI